MSRILFLDIETAPNTAYVWGLFDQNIAHNQVETSSYILCWAAKWAGQAGIIYDSIQKQHGLTRPTEMMLRAIHKLLDEADIVVHYNGLKFDIPVLNKEFVKHGLPPPSPYKQVDMLRVCRGAFRFESNKLAAVVKALGLGAKLTNHGFELWVGCMKNEPAAWKKMERYNKRDVTILERLYHRLLPWIAKHPNLSVHAVGDRLCCPKCGSAKTQRRGSMVARWLTYARYQCQTCGTWFRGNRATHKSKAEKGVNL